MKIKKEVKQKPRGDFNVQHYTVEYLTERGTVYLRKMLLIFCLSLAKQNTVRLYISLKSLKNI